MLKLLRSSGEVRRLFLAHSVSRAGDAFNTVALVVLVFELTGSAARLLSLALGGVLVDIIDIRLVYVISAGLLIAAATVGLTANLEPTTPETIMQ